MCLFPKRNKMLFVCFWAGLGQCHYINTIWIWIEKAVLAIRSFVWLQQIGNVLYILLPVACNCCCFFLFRPVSKYTKDISAPHRMEMYQHKRIESWTELWKLCHSLLLSFVGGLLKLEGKRNKCTFRVLECSNSSTLPMYFS